MDFISSFVKLHHPQALIMVWSVESNPHEKSHVYTRTAPQRGPSTIAKLLSLHRSKFWTHFSHHFCLILTKQSNYLALLGILRLLPTIDISLVPTMRMNIPRQSLQFQGCLENFRRSYKALAAEYTRTSRWWRSVLIFSLTDAVSCISIFMTS